MAFDTEDLNNLVLPFSGDDSETDVMLYFTDNKNEPRSINIRRCIETDDSFSGNAPSYSGQNLEDFITACPRVPSVPIEIDYAYDLSDEQIMLESNFTDTDGFIFAYQNIYRNGYVSSLSEYSKVAFPPSIASLGSRPKEEVLVENRISLYIPRQGLEVRRIRILFKEGDGGTWKVIDEVSADVDQSLPNYTFFGAPANPVAGIYKFYNNEIFPVVPLDEASKHFDKLPAKAQTQAVSGNRLMYGNYEEGFDPVLAAAKSTVIYKERLQDLVTFDLVAEPIVAPNGAGSSTGFVLSTEGLPEVINEGLYEININMVPRRNLHVFNTHNSYKPSRHITLSGETDMSGTNPNFTGSTEGAPLFTTPTQNIQTDTGTPTTSLPMFVSGNSGAGIGFWKDSINEARAVKVGSTPSAPLILNVTSIPVDIVLQVNSSTTRQELVQVVSDLLTGAPNVSNLHTYIENNFNITVVFANGNTPNSGEDGSIESEVEINAGLSSGQEFSHQSSKSQLVSTFKAIEEEGVIGMGGFFIINKAFAKFSFENIPTGDTISLNQFQRAVFLRIKSLETDSSEDALLTCFPAPAKGFQTPILLENTGNLVMPDNPWRILRNTNANGGMTVDGAHIFWPNKDYANLKAFDGTRLYTNQVNSLFSESPEEHQTEDGEINESISDFSTERHPVRIGKWLALNKEAVINQEFEEFYSVKLDTQLNNEASISGIPLDELGGGGTVTLGLRNGLMSELLKTDILAFAFDLEGPGTAIASVSASTGWDGYMNDFQLAVQSGGSSTLSVIDGDCGPGGRRSLGVPFSDVSIDIDGEEEKLEASVFVSGDTYIGSTPSTQWPFLNAGDFNFETSGALLPKHNRYGSIWNTSLYGHVTNMPYIDATGKYLDVTSAENLSHNSLIKQGAYDALYINDIGITSNFSSLSDTELSFKTRSTHDFGIVYYDKRGRRGAVNKLKSVYVPGYSDTERPDENKGSVAIKLEILHAAPDWASKYKIFYSNKSETKRFIQYMSGGAYTEKGVSANKSKIYVSLNYLQGNKISYAKGFGARSQDTDEPTLYRYSPGDKLRVISYYNTDTDRDFAPDEAVFSVVGVETLTDNMEDHPLYSSEGFTEDDATKKLQRNGQFVVLQNNPLSQGTGFSALEIEGGTDLWGNRCLFEISSPRKETIEEAQPYFETLYGGDIAVNAEGQFSHQQPFGGHLIDEGDVFFRAIPANIRPFENGAFTDIIKTNDQDEDISDSNFKPYYVESEGLTDLHRSVAKGYGKPNFIDPEAFRKKMQASVIFSQITDPNRFKLKHTSFPSNEESSFHLPEKHGSLNFIVGEDEYITSLQENKVAVIPVDRAITSTAQGRDTVNISDKVLNSAKFFFGDGGPSGNPESVSSVDGYVYFVDKRNKRVSRVSPGGTTVENISDLGMGEYFKRQITSLIESSEDINKKDIRIVTGFDPMENEIIVSLLPPDAINSINQTDLVQQLSFPFQSAPLRSPLALAEINNDELFVNTIAFDHKGGKAWKTRYSYNSTNYAKVNNSFISFKPFGSKFVWEHGKAPLRNNFHGHRYLSMIKTVSNSSSQRGLGGAATKVYKALSLDGTSTWPSIVKTEKEMGVISSFNNYEGTKYAAMPKSETSSTSNVRSIGNVSKAVLSGVTPVIGIPVNIRVDFDKPINKGAVDLALTTEFFFGGLGDAEKMPQVLNVEILSDYSMSFDVPNPGTQGLADLERKLIAAKDKPLIHRSHSAIYGDNLRDKYITVSSYNNSPEPVDLYSVNLEVVGSKLDVTT